MLMAGAVSYQPEILVDISVQEEKHAIGLKSGTCRRGRSICCKSAVGGRGCMLSKWDLRGRIQQIIHRSTGP